MSLLHYQRYCILLHSLHSTRHLTGHCPHRPRGFFRPSSFLVSVEVYVGVHCPHIRKFGVRKHAVRYCRRSDRIGHTNGLPEYVWRFEETLQCETGMVVSHSIHKKPESIANDIQSRLASGSPARLLGTRHLSRSRCAQATQRLACFEVPAACYGVRCLCSHSWSCIDAVSCISQRRPSFQGVPLPSHHHLRGRLSDSICKAMRS